MLKNMYVALIMSFFAVSNSFAADEATQAVRNACAADSNVTLNISCDLQVSKYVPASTDSSLLRVATDKNIRITAERTEKISYLVEFSNGKESKALIEETSEDVLEGYVAYHQVTGFKQVVESGKVMFSKISCLEFTSKTIPQFCANGVAGIPPEYRYSRDTGKYLSICKLHTCIRQK